MLFCALAYRSKWNDRFNGNYCCSYANEMCAECGAFASIHSHLNRNRIKIRNASNIRIIIVEDKECAEVTLIMKMEYYQIFKRIAYLNCLGAAFWLQFNLVDFSFLAGVLYSLFFPSSSSSSISLTPCAHANELCRFSSKTN